MGFNAYRIDDKGNKVGGFATVWSVQDKGNYSDVQLSTSKSKKDGGWENDFQGFVRFVGPAHSMAKGITERTVIRIKNCDVTKYYSPKTEKDYFNFVVFEFEFWEGGDNKKSTSNKKSTQSKNPMEEDFMKVPDTDDEELPF